MIGPLCRENALGLSPQQVRPRSKLSISANLDLGKAQNAFAFDLDAAMVMDLVHPTARALDRIECRFF